MTFPTQYRYLDAPERFRSEHGDPIHITYAPHFDETGHYELVESGKINIYDEIQSHADSVDIHILLKRYAEGDAGALAKAQGVFMDVTGMPRTYAEMINILNDANAAFLTLPVEERAKYDHSFEVWLSSLTPESFTQPVPTSDAPAPAAVADAVGSTPSAAVQPSSDAVPSGQ